MSFNREYSHIILASTPFKIRMDEKAMKLVSDIEKDKNIAYKCADRFNFNANIHRKVTLSDRFELAALGFEMKAKPNSSLDNEESDEPNCIYRKEKKNDISSSPIAAGSSPTSPLLAGRGFLSPATQATNHLFAFSGNIKFSPKKHASITSHPQIRTVFDGIPANIP